MVVMHIVAPARFGGIESVVRALCAGHQRRGHVVHVACVLSPGEPAAHPFVDALESAGIQTHVLRIPARSYTKEWRALRVLIGKHAPAVVHTHGFRSDTIGGWSARAEGVARVSTCHGFIDSGWRSRAYQRIQRRSLRSFDAVIAVSNPIAVQLRHSGIAASRISIVPNAFALSTPPLPRDEARQRLGLGGEQVIGWVGRFSAEKGPDIAIEAFARSGAPDARLVMIGSGRDESALRELARTRGVADRVAWPGALANASTVFTAFDAFLLSSRTEGTPIALLEAIAEEIPVIATRVGGVPEVIDQESARLVPAGDVGALGDAIRETLANPDAAAQRAAVARVRLDQRFATEPWLAAHESIYEGAIRHAAGAQEHPALAR